MTDEAVTCGQLGLLATAAGLYLDRMQHLRARTGELFAARLVRAGLAVYVSPTAISVHGGVPRTHEQVRELYAALQALERLREPEPMPLATGDHLDRIASDMAGIGRNPGETDAELRARIKSNWPGA